MRSVNVAHAERKKIKLHAVSSNRRRRYNRTGFPASRRAQPRFLVTPSRGEGYITRRVLALHHGGIGGGGGGGGGDRPRSRHRRRHRRYEVEPQSRLG